MKQVKFKQWTCKVIEKEYGLGGRLALELLDWETNEPIAMATVNIPHWTPGEDCVFIKDWSENEGILKALVDAKVVQPTGMKIPTGYVEAHECRYLGNT